jgi:O-antigen ligase
MNYYYLVNRYLFIWRLGYGGLDNNGAGLMLAMIAPCCLVLWNGEHRWWRWGYLAFLPVIVHAILMSYSRGAMLSLIAVTPILLWRQRLFSWTTVFLAILVFVGLPLMAGPEIQQRFFSIEQYETDGSAQSRLTSWAIGWKMATDRPYLGFGLRNSNLYTFDYGADIYGRTIHNQYLQVAADSGMTGLLLYIIGLALTWRLMTRCRRRLKRSQVRNQDVVRALMIADCVEASMVVFCFCAIFLWLVVFELPFLMLLLGGQLETVTAATVPEAFQEGSSHPRTLSSVA